MKDRSLPPLHRLPSALRGVRLPSSCRAHAHGWSSNVVTRGCSSCEELLAPRHRERADHADAGQRAVVVVEAEQQRADRVRPALVQPVAGDDAVGGALVLDLEHGPLVRLVGAVERLRDHAVETGALELVEPLLGDASVRGRRREMDGCAGADERFLERGAALGERVACVVDVAEREQVERDERAGVCSASIFTRLAAGWIRCCSASKSSLSPEAPITTISPSTTQRSGRFALIASTSSGKYRVIGRSFRLPISTSSTVAEDDRAEAVPLRLEADRARRGSP